MTAFYKTWVGGQILISLTLAWLSYLGIFSFLHFDLRKFLGRELNLSPLTLHPCVLARHLLGVGSVHCNFFSTGPLSLELRSAELHSKGWMFPMTLCEHVGLTQCCIPYFTVTRNRGSFCWVQHVPEQIFKIKFWKLGMISYSEINRYQVNTTHFNPSCRAGKYASCAGGESTSEEKYHYGKKKRRI